MKTTKKQQKAIKKLFDRNSDGSGSFLQFRRRAKQCGVASDNYMGINWCKMFVGIEKDGYTHT